MMSKSFRVKFVLVAFGIALTVFFARHFIFATALQTFLSRATHENFDYQKRSWQEGNLVYENVSFGDELFAPELKFTPEFTLFPFHLSLEVYFTQPHFKLSSDSEPAFSLALLVPTKWTAVKLDIERGTFSIDNTPQGLIDFVSSPTALGTLILSEEEKSAYFSCELSLRGHELHYRVTCNEAPALQLQAVATLFSGPLPLQFEGGRIDAELEGPSLQGSMRGTDLKLTRGDLSVDQAEIQVMFYQDKPPQLHLKGHLAYGDIQGPFSCDARTDTRTDLGGDKTVEGKFQFVGLDVPFQFYYEGGSSILHADFTNVPLTLLKLEKGFASAHATAIFGGGQLQGVELKKLQLTELLSAPILGSVSFDKSGGDFTASSDFMNSSVKGIFEFQAGLFKWKGDIVAHSDQLQAAGAIDFTTLDWNAEFFAPALKIANYTPLFPEGSLEVRGVANGKEVRLSCIGSDILFQKEDAVLQIPGRTTPLAATFSLLNKKLLAEMRVPPATLYLKNLTAPIYLESGALSWKEDVLEIEHLQACVEEIVFQGDLAYWHAPTPHLQLKSKSVEGQVQDLCLFDRRLKGWEGHFSCGELGFILDTDIGVGTPHIQISDMTAALSIKEREVAVHISKFSGKEGKYAFECEVPGEKISLMGEVANDTVTLTHAQMGLSKITAPLIVICRKDSWQIKGGAAVALDSLTHYLPLLQDAGFFRDVLLPPMEGSVQISGQMSNDKSALDVHAGRVKIGEISIPSLNGHIQRDKNRIKSDNLCIGSSRIKAVAIYENKSWVLPQWSASFSGFFVQGSARFAESVCFLEGSGTWSGMGKEHCQVEGALQWNVKTKQGKLGRLLCTLDGAKVEMNASEMYFKEGKLQLPLIQSSFYHPALKESIIAPISFTWTPDRVLFQGPLTQGCYEYEQIALKARDIQGLYENGIIHFQSKLLLNDSPIKMKGHFFTTEAGRGVVNFSEGENNLKLTFTTFSDIAKIEGKLLGIDCSVEKKGALFEGRVHLKTSDPIAALVKKPEWKEIHNLQFLGSLSLQSLRGTITGEDVALNGYLLSSIQASIDYGPTQFEITQLKIEDKAGQLLIRECHGNRSHPLKAWEIHIPNIRGQQIQPSLMRKLGESVKNPKPFQMRQLTLTNVTGILGRPLSFTGSGSFYFTQREKRDPTLFDLPRAFLKEWGLDLALLTPTRGSATIELKQGKIILSSLQETFSDSDHSEFYLAPEEPSYIDFKGALFLNLRMKQYVALKLVEPFTLSVRGTWEKPLYTLR